MSIKRLINLISMINFNILSNMIHNICQEIFFIFDEIACMRFAKGEKNCCSRQFANVSIFRQFDNVSDFFFFQICFDASSGQPHLQSIEFQIFFSYKIIPGIVNNTVNFDYKWNMPLSLKLPLCDY